MSEATISLRERNRREAWGAIHGAATELALQHGVAGTTVEMIASAAGVSRRTFFNYFSTKEDAILGIQEPWLPEGAAGRLAAGENLLEQTVQLIGEVVRSAAPEPETTRRLLPLIKKEPELKAGLRRVATAGEHLLEPVLLDELGSRHPDRPQQRLRDEARAMTMIAGSIIRFAYNRDPAALGQKHSAALRHATETFQTVFKETM